MKLKIKSKEEKQKGKKKKRIKRNTKMSGKVNASGLVSKNMTK